MIESAYRTLRISREATPEEARAAYVRLVKRYPPEMFPEKFSEVREAYRQICLDDSFLSVLGGEMLKNASVAEFAVFLWGDRKELKYDCDEGLTGLSELLSGGEIARELDRLLETIDISNVEWMGV
jgi:hypothetical protein